MEAWHWIEISLLILSDVQWAETQAMQGESMDKDSLLCTSTLDEIPW